MSDKLTLEIAEQQLEIIVQKMENPDIEFEELMDCFREAARLIEFSYKYLHESSLEITVLQQRIEEAKKLVVTSNDEENND